MAQNKRSLKGILSTPGFRRPGASRAGAARGGTGPGTGPRTSRRGLSPEQKQARTAVEQRQAELYEAFPKLPRHPHPDTPRQMARRILIDAVKAEFAREAARHVELPEGWGRAELTDASLASAPWFVEVAETTVGALELEPSLIPLSDVPALRASAATADAYGMGLEAASDLASVLLTQAWHLQREMVQAGERVDSAQLSLDDQLAAEQEALRGEARRTLLRVVTVPLEMKAVLRRHERGLRAERTAQATDGDAQRIPDDLGGRSRRSAGETGFGGGDEPDAAGAADEDPLGDAEFTASANGGYAFRPGSGAGGGTGARARSQGTPPTGPDVQERIKSFQEFLRSPEGQRLISMAGVGARQAWKIYQKRTRGPGRPSV